MLLHYVVLWAMCSVILKASVCLACKVKAFRWGMMLQCFQTPLPNFLKKKHSMCTPSFSFVIKLRCTAGNGMDLGTFLSSWQHRQPTPQNKKALSLMGGSVQLVLLISVLFSDVRKSMKNLWVCTTSLEEAKKQGKKQRATSGKASKKRSQQSKSKSSKKKKKKGSKSKTVNQKYSLAYHRACSAALAAGDDEETAKEPM